MDVEKIVIDCAATVYEREASEICLDTVVTEELSSQSLMLVMFISDIEDQTGVQIDLREAAELRTIGDFVQKVQELLA